MRVIGFRWECPSLVRILSVEARIARVPIPLVPRTMPTYTSCGRIRACPKQYTLFGISLATDRT
jgi:hypothetical protein